MNPDEIVNTPDTMDHWSVINGVSLAEEGPVSPARDPRLWRVPVRTQTRTAASSLQGLDATFSLLKRRRGQICLDPGWRYGADYSL